MNNDQPRQTNSANAEPRNRNHVLFDFRERIDKLPPCTLFGPELDSVATTDLRGLRINLAKERQNHDVVGVDVPIWLLGDFDINFGYEILNMDGAVPKNGKSVAMRVMFGESPYPVTALICRGRKPSGDHFETFKLVKDKDGKDRYQLNKTFGAAELKGRLRLVRTGALLHYYAADGGAETRALRSLEIGTDDVRLIRLYVTTDYKPVPLDVRFTDLDIRAEKLGNMTSADQSPPAAPTANRSLAPLAVALVIALLLMLASSFAAWLYFRRSRANKPAAADPSISFACPDCGKTLKARPELADKKVKCPKCGQPVSVPSITPALLPLGEPRLGQVTRSRTVWPLLMGFSLCLLALSVLSCIAYVCIVERWRHNHAGANGRFLRFVGAPTSWTYRPGP